MKSDPFQVVQEDSPSAYILHLSGDLDLSIVPQLRTALEQVMKRSDKALVLNMRGLTYIDSTGIGIVVSVLKYRDEMNAPFYVKEIPPAIRRLFDLTGISRYLNEGIEDEA